MVSLPVLRREGECNRCGSCCKGDPFNGERGVGPVAGACPYYREGTGCSDRTEANAYYWAACRHWPDGPAAVKDHPLCSYRFG